MKHVFYCEFLFLAAVAAKPALDPVILQPTGLRYQHVQGLAGLLLTDTWVKMSDFTAAVRYRPDEEIVYYVFSRANPSTRMPVVLGNADMLSRADFNPRRRTAVIVHGWTGNATHTLNRVLVPAFLAAGDYNVIVVDWSAGSSGDYMSSVVNTVASGESVARFINWLTSVTSASCSDFHLVGHSLGAHLVGNIGRNVNSRVDYITSLDPAWPLWILNDYKFRADDGVYTEVIHTNVGEAGHVFPLGQVDFYANNGIRMPGCPDQSCSHDRCFWYFAESLTNGRFTGVECSQWHHALLNTCDGQGTLRMGGTAPKHGSTGIFRFDTNAEQPFSLG